LVTQAAQAADRSQGFYLWGAYNHRGFWTNIYLGQAGFGKTAHLQERIRKELSSERCALWRLVLGEKELMGVRAQHHGSRFVRNWLRSFQKAGATYIIWVADPELSNRDVQNIESDLIELLNPSANFKRPVPPTSLQQHTHMVVGHFRRLIHSERERRYHIGHLAVSTG